MTSKHFWLGISLLLCVLTFSFTSVAQEEDPNTLIERVEANLRAWEARLQKERAELTAAATASDSMTQLQAEQAIQQRKQSIEQYQAAQAASAKQFDSEKQALSTLVTKFLGIGQAPPTEELADEEETEDTLTEVDSVEQEFWRTVQEADAVEMYEAYLQQYPDGQFIVQANQRIKELRGGQTPPPETDPLPDDNIAKKPEPMRDPEQADLYLRLLSLPGATLHSEPAGTAVGDELAAFTVLYIYDQVKKDRQTWYQVGRNARGDIEGWLDSDQTEQWRTMLVMQYAPKGQRERVLFFRNREDLASMVSSPYLASDIKKDYERIAERRHDGEIFIAIEPATAVSASQRPYLMPILDWEFESFDNGEETTLVQVAGLNLSQTKPPEPGSRAVLKDMSRGLARRQSELRDFKIGIVFVIDTTSSMGPYIQQAQEIVKQIHNKLREQKLGNNIGFGLVGYRDNTQTDQQGIEYVTHIYQPLTLGTSSQQFIDNLLAMRAAEASTVDWREDAYAGLYTAIESLDWEPFDSRVVVLITDAGARSGNDPLATTNIDTSSLLAMAQLNKNMAIFPVHLQTKEARRSGNLELAREQYYSLGQSGDRAVNKYIPISAGALELYSRELSSVADEIEKVLFDGSQGVMSPPPEDLPNDIDLFTETAVAPSPTEQPPLMGTLFANEVFRAQLEYLGETQGAEAPRFYRAWAADRDLLNPRIETLRVSVFLTRNQLSTLAQSLQRLVDAAENRDTSATTFFDDLQALSATTSVDPERPDLQNDQFVLGELLPAFLKVLPYRSKILKLDKQLWLEMGNTGQGGFINELKSKLATYRIINENQDQWIDLGAGDPGLDVYAVGLDQLP